MDDRGYVAQALFDRLSGDGVAFRILGESEGYPERAPAEVQLAVPRAALDGIPRALGAFCQELDLQLVHLAPEDSRAWRCVLAWSDEVGRPRFMSARICSDYCRGLRCYLRAEELLDASADTLFSHALVDAVERGELTPENAGLAVLAMERGSARRDRARGALLAGRRQHPPHRAGREARRMERRCAPRSGRCAARCGARCCPSRRTRSRAWRCWRAALAQPAQAAVVFMGRESALRSAVLADVKRDLAPLGLQAVRGRARRRRARSCAWCLTRAIRTPT